MVTDASPNAPAILAYAPSHALDNFSAASTRPYEPRLVTPRTIKQQGKLYDLIEPAVRFGLTPHERGAAIRDVHARTGKALRTIERHVAHFLAHGLDGLLPRERSNKGEPRVFVSRLFDQAYAEAGHPPELLPKLATFVDDQIKELWKGRAADGGSTELGQLAGFVLLERCEALGLALPNDVFVIDKYRANRWRDREVVNLRNNNAKAFQDSLPSVHRDWTAYAPMEIVVADVKHLDVLITRADGSETYPKLIGFMDGGTGRIFPYLVECPQRRSITQELVIEAFCAMVSDPNWGFPQKLYLDNGSEFSGLDKIKPAIALLNKKAGREIIRAQPYSAQSKPIEPLFARLDRYCFASLPGYTGGNRMDKKTQNVGRKPKPFPGGWEEFTATVRGLISYYHGRKVGGQWEDRSPNDVFRSKVEAGWRPIFPKPLALEMAFCDHRTLTVSKQGIRVGPHRYYHPELERVTVGSKLDAVMPWRKDAPPIVILPEIGAVQLQLDLPYPALSLDGAREARRRKDSYRQTPAKFASEGEAIDPVQIKLRMAARQTPVTIPGRPALLDQGAALHDLTTARLQSSAGETDEETIRRKRREREDRITANLVREQARARQ